MIYIIDSVKIPWREAPPPLPRYGKILHDGVQNPQVALVSIGLFKFKPSQYGLPHTHKKEVEMFFTIAGTGTLVIDGNDYQVKPGTLAIVPPGIEHHPVNNGDNDWHYLAIFTPAFDMSFINEWKPCSP
ncbi:cupin domain-containing protein [Moorella sp. ACPs]|jgi:quercetin dioxygenase-like cupin family protein|uniref:cupin domain-containing protein n=1 Tax=Neomoorella carbonis TaxID=3062783 RepID=UPI00324EDB2E